MYTPFGQVGVTVIATAAANAAVNIQHAVAVKALQDKFAGKLESDAAKMAYLKLLIIRFRSLGVRLARTTRARPGTKEFDILLRHALKHDMNYKGGCDVDIYIPFRPGDVMGKPRPVWGSISGRGFVTGGNVPRDVGPIWASGCKGAHDEFKTAYIVGLKGKRRFTFLKSSKEDIGTMGLFLKFGSGLLLAMVLLTMVKIQKAVVKKQSGS